MLELDTRGAEETGNKNLGRENALGNSREFGPKKRLVTVSHE